MFIKVREMMVLHIGFPLLQENEKNEFQINSRLFKNNKKRTLNVPQIVIIIKMSSKFLIKPINPFIAKRRRNKI